MHGVILMAQTLIGNVACHKSIDAAIHRLAVFIFDRIEVSCLAAFFSIPLPWGLLDEAV